MYKFPLLHRLDKDTSGVLLLVKNDEFASLAINEFKKMKVEKIYVAAVRGIMSEEVVVNEPILTIKNKMVPFQRYQKMAKRRSAKFHRLWLLVKKHW